MKKPVIILVGADKGGVGKTFVARVVDDWLGTMALNHRVIDTQPEPGSLKRFCPKAELIDLADVAGQMSIFDQAKQPPVTLIDVRASLLSPTLKTMRDIGLIAAVERGDLRLVVMHVLGPSIDSLDEIGTIGGYLAMGGLYVCVKNYTNDSQFFEWDPQTYQRYAKAADAKTLISPMLVRRAAEAVDLAHVSFEKFIKDAKPNDFVLPGYVRHWLDQEYGELDRVITRQAILHGVAGAGANG